eukprot:Em0012g442a
MTLGPWLAQVHIYPELWVHGTAQSLPQSALQLTRMAPISTESTNELWSHPQCSGTVRDVGSLVGAGAHLPCGNMEQLRVCPKVLCKSQEWHPSPLVILYTPTLWVHGTAQSLPQSALQLTRMAPISIGQIVHIYPELWVHGTAQSLPQSALQLTRMAPISTESTNELWSHPQCSGTVRDVGSLVGAGAHLPCGNMEQLRVCPKVLCKSQEWHPSPLVIFVLDPRVTLGPWLAQVHTYPVGTWNSSESAPICFATHKNGTHLHCVLDPRVTLGPWLAQVHTSPVGTWNSSESASKCFATHKNDTHLHCVLDPRVTLGPWLAQVHIYPVGTWNSSESASKCFATHKNGTHLHWYTPTLWVHGTAQILPQNALQLTRMAPISIGQLLHTYLVGTWNSCESASKCFATHKNGTHLHGSASQSLPQSALQLTRMTPISIGQIVHIYPVGTWNSSESASKCFATHKNGTHLHWYTPTLWVHGTAQILPQNALQLTRMAPISIGQLLHTYLVGTWNSCESASKCFATHKNGTHLHGSACTHLPCGYMEQLRVCLKVLCNSQDWHPSPLVSLYTYPVGTWNSSESAPKCFATHKNGTHLHCYTPTLWVHGTAASLRQSALQLTRMAPIFTGQLVHTYPVGTWNSSESAPKCFATHKNGTHLHCYTPTLWVHGTAASLRQSALQLTRMAPIFTGQLVHIYPVGTWNSSESASKCFATHKNGTHLHCVLDPRVTLGPWLALVHTYPVGTWNSSESASKCFATHKNGTHLH